MDFFRSQHSFDAANFATNFVIFLVDRVNLEHITCCHNVHPWEFQGQFVRLDYIIVSEFDIVLFGILVETFDFEELLCGVGKEFFVDREKSVSLERGLVDVFGDKSVLHGKFESGVSEIKNLRI